VVRRVLPLMCIATLAGGVRAAPPGTHAVWRGAEHAAPVDASFSAAEVAGDVVAHLLRARAAASATPPATEPAATRAWGFHFTRGAYSGFRRGRFESWSTDYPKADLQFVSVLARLTNVDAYPGDNAIWLDDPELRRHPFLYLVEVGFMSLTEPEVRGLRDYLLAGGFLIVDDFWGTRQWANFEEQMRRVLPEHGIVELPLDHPIFSIFYEIDEIIQVPAINRAWGPTHEQDGYVPHVRGIFDDDGRLMAIINWNTDLGDAWEWAEQPHYPLKYSTYAFRMGVNMVVYALSH
jgi:hypothetical protein